MNGTIYGINGVVLLNKIYSNKDKKETIKKKRQKREEIKLKTETSVI
jgi:hypothetical protein